MSKRNTTDAASSGKTAFQGGVEKPIEDIDTGPFAPAEEPKLERVEVPDE